LSIYEQNELALLLADLKHDEPLSDKTKKELSEIKITLSGQDVDTKPYKVNLEEFFANKEIIEFIKDKRISVIRFPASGVHLRIGGAVDYWPKSEKFYNVKRNKKGKGESDLLNELRKIYK
jgi:hypothetical protein